MWESTTGSAYWRVAEGDYKRKGVSCLALNQAFAMTDDVTDEVGGAGVREGARREQVH